MNGGKLHENMEMSLEGKKSVAIVVRWASRDLWVTLITLYIVGDFLMRDDWPKWNYFRERPPNVRFVGYDAFKSFVSKANKRRFFGFWIIIRPRLCNFIAYN